MILKETISKKFEEGCVIPAHPLALDSNFRLDERRQQALTRYYLDAGAGGLAVGVHTTQFQIHDPKVGLYQPVLALAAETAGRYADSSNQPIMIAGIVGRTDQAVREASIARNLGYDLGLLSLIALKDAGVDEMLDHARAVAEVIPIMGFYLQQSISGMTLPKEFWRELAEIPNVAGIKIAPFNRYQTLDVLEAVAESSRRDEIVLYTGNDDNIILDLLSKYEFVVNGEKVSLRITGGLLGQWACWTRNAVEIFRRIKSLTNSDLPIPPDMLTLACQLTLANKAIFDVDNNFAGCIAGISYVLKTQGLLENTLTLDPAEKLSPGQAEKIDRIIRDYPHLTDDEFIRERLSSWLSV
jgi:dihydrodipicolinate synthase/N-acetylneuraminate lyase